MIEGGISATGALVPQQIRELGAGAEDVTQLVITHAHPDHVMAVPQIRQAFPGIAVLASPIAAQTLANEKAVSFFRKMDGSLIEGLSKAGLIAAESEQASSDEMTIVVDRTVGEGDTIRRTESRSTCSPRPGTVIAAKLPRRRGGLLIISDATGYYMPEHDDWWPNYLAITATT